MEFLTGQKITEGRKSGKVEKVSFEQGAVLYYVKKAFPDAVCRFAEPFESSMEIDVYIPSEKIGIDYDGLSRHKAEDDFRKEIKKYLYCKKYGITLFRITEEDPREWGDTADDVYCVLGGTYKADFSVVLQYLLDRIDPELRIVEKKGDLPPVRDRVLVDIDGDRQELIEFRNAVNDPLCKLRPDLAEQWHPEKNGELLPQNFGTVSNAKVWWKCPRCGYEWEAVISQRAKKQNSSCPQCIKQDRKTKGSLFLFRKL